MASLIDLWDNFPDLIKEFPRKYTLHLFNYASSCLPVKLYNKIPEILQKAKTVAVRPFNKEAEVFQSVSYLNFIKILNQKIQQLKTNKGRQLGLEELELWAESKIKRKPIIEIMKDRL